MSKYDGYKWIKVKHHKFDPAKSWEENYRDLEKHHIEETTFLIDEVRGLYEEYSRGDMSIDRIVSDAERRDDLDR